MKIPKKKKKKNLGQRNVTSLITNFKKLFLYYVTMIMTTG